MPSSDSFLRQLSGREGWKSTSKRWGTGGGLKQMEGLNMYYGNGGGGDQNGGGGGMMMRKRVMVVVDQSSHSKHAMMWALTHVTNKGDLLTLLHIIPPPSSERPSDSSSSSTSPYLASSLGSLCKACKPEVEVEALVIRSPNLNLGFLYKKSNCQN
ncbi:uncharacterized protein LOC114313416 [Camellia sinensis]|uniref:uncharacterized protein LOC114313416 n=1 Tax=Camellia sinensis TaxID=4442 RepID=UPI00103550E9|nr:uncharacterized protein LOC114313416 [Camellia sinensis]